MYVSVTSRASGSHASHRISRLAPGLTAVQAGAATDLLPQRQLADHHAPIGRLAHVVHGQRGDGTCVEGLHLDAGAVDGLDVGLDGDEVVADLEVDRHAAHEQRVAERDHVGGPLGCLDARHPGYGQHVTLVHLTIGDRRGRLGLHEHLAAGHGSPMRRLFRRDIDHPGAAEWIEVGERQVTHVDRHASRRYVPDVPLPYDALQVIRDEGVELLDVLGRYDPDTPVPACPGWNLGDLAWHVGEVWNFWARVVDEHMTDLAAVRTIERHARPVGAALGEWVAAAHTAIYSSLVDTRVEREVWTWTGANRHVDWVRRRMAQESAMHSWDASSAVGQPDDIDPLVAADGIDEFLTWFANIDGLDGRAAGPGGLGGTVHLHCTDTDGEWFVSAIDASGARFTREHAKGDTAIRGRAGDLVLWLWRRHDHNVDIIGDAELAARFRSASRLVDRLD